MTETDRINGVSALELTMRDVLGNMEELANGYAWLAGGWDSVEILKAVKGEGLDVKRGDGGLSAPCERPSGSDAFAERSYRGQTAAPTLKAVPSPRLHCC